MSADELPACARKLLYEYIESYEQLEVLLLTQGTRDRTWTLEAAVAQLREADQASAALRALSVKGLIRAQIAGAAFYAPCCC